MKRLAPVTILILGIAALYPLQRWIDDTSPREAINDETLYLSGNTVKRVSLGLEGLAADIYWIRASQYFGRKLIDSGEPLSSAASQKIQMDMLAPLLNVIVTLDPHHLSAYRFGAIFLPERDLPAAIALLEKGIRENPGEWRLYQDLAYIYWQAGNAETGQKKTDYYAKAAEWYDKGSNVPGAYWWMRDLAGFMRIEGGSRETAYAIYSSYLNSEDPQVRNQAILRLKQLRSIEDLEIINQVLAEYIKATKTCPPDLRPLAAALRARKITVNDEQYALDPDGFTYYVDSRDCTARVQLYSTIPR